MALPSWQERVAVAENIIVSRALWLCPLTPGATPGRKRYDYTHQPLHFEQVTVLSSSEDDHSLDLTFMGRDQLHVMERYWCSNNTQWVEMLSELVIPLSSRTLGRYDICT